MTFHPFLLMTFIISLHFSFIQAHPCIGQHSSKDSLSLVARNEEGASEEDSRKGVPQPPVIRTWIVDFSTGEIKPENLAAKEMYR